MMFRVLLPNFSKMLAAPLKRSFLSSDTKREVLHCSEGSRIQEGVLAIGKASGFLASLAVRCADGSYLRFVGGVRTLLFCHR